MIYDSRFTALMMGYKADVVLRANRFVHNNQGRDVKVITYDELLVDFGTLIFHRLDEGTEV